MTRHIKLGLKTYREVKLKGRKGYQYTCVDVDFEPLWLGATGYTFIQKEQMKPTPFTKIEEVQWKQQAA